MLRKLVRKLSVSTSPSDRKWRQGTSSAQSAISGQHSKLEYDCIVDDVAYYSRNKKAAYLYNKYTTTTRKNKYSDNECVNTIRANLGCLDRMVDIYLN